MEGQEGITRENADWNGDLKVGQWYAIITVKLTTGSDAKIDRLTRHQPSP
jgi:hypothetical protein